MILFIFKKSFSMFQKISFKPYFSSTSSLKPKNSNKHLTTLPHLNLLLSFKYKPILKHLSFLLKASFPYHSKHWSRNTFPLKVSVNLLLYFQPKIFSSRIGVKQLCAAPSKQRTTYGGIFLKDLK